MGTRTGVGKGLEALSESSMTQSARAVGRVQEATALDVGMDKLAGSMFPKGRTQS